MPKPLKHKKEYSFNWAMKTLCILFIILVCALYKTNLLYEGTFKCFYIITGPIFILMCIAGLIAKYKITETGPIVIIWPIIRRHVFWEDIKMIYDDNFSSAHFYMFKLRGEQGKRFGFQNTITNYKDFLRESIMRVRPDTEVQDKILELVGLTRADIGKLYKPPEQKVSRA